MSCKQHAAQCVYWHSLQTSPHFIQQCAGARLPQPDATTHIQFHTALLVYTAAKCKTVSIAHAEHNMSSQCVARTLSLLGAASAHQTRRYGTAELAAVSMCAHRGVLSSICQATGALAVSRRSTAGHDGMYSKSAVLLLVDNACSAVRRSRRHQAASIQSV